MTEGSGHAFVEGDVRVAAAGLGVIRPGADCPRTASSNLSVNGGWSDPAKVRPGSGIQDNIHHRLPGLANTDEATWKRDVLWGALIGTTAALAFDDATDLPAAAGPAWGAVAVRMGLPMAFGLIRSPRLHFEQRSRGSISAKVRSPYS
jgi:hypothetical protein